MLEGRDEARECEACTNTRRASILDSQVVQPLQREPNCMAVPSEAIALEVRSCPPAFRPSLSSLTCSQCSHRSDAAGRLQGSPGVTETLEGGRGRCGGRLRQIDAIEGNRELEGRLLYCYIVSTVEPLYRGHHWDPASCHCIQLEPLYRGHHWDPASCPVYSGTSL